MTTSAFVITNPPDESNKFLAFRHLEAVRPLQWQQGFPFHVSHPSGS